MDEEKYFSVRVEIRLMCNITNLNISDMKKVGVMTVDGSVICLSFIQHVRTVNVRSELNYAGL